MNPMMSVLLTAAESTGTPAMPNYLVDQLIVWGVSPPCVIVERDPLAVHAPNGVGHGAVTGDRDAEVVARVASMAMLGVSPA